MPSVCVVIGKKGRTAALFTYQREYYIACFGVIIGLFA